MGDYRNSFLRSNAQKSQIFDLVKPAGHPPFLARPGQMKKKSRQKGGGVRTPPLFAQIAFSQNLTTKFGSITHKMRVMSDEDDDSDHVLRINPDN